MLKRCFDFIISIVALIVLSPILLLIAVLIKATSSGSIFFRQERVGRFGYNFHIHKFRTMVAGSEFIGPQITTENDVRITKIGHFLRRYKLDELPQLIDVCFGDMSLVGPRPEVPKYVSCYPKEVRDVVLSVRPGITDLASIAYRKESEILTSALDPNQVYISEVLPAKLEFYVDYVKHRSFWGDIRIIILTIKVVLF